MQAEKCFLGELGMKCHCAISKVILSIVFTALSLSSARAAIVVDMDDAAPGIQATRTVNAGSTFGIRIVLIADSTIDPTLPIPFKFDIFTVDLSYNSSAGILALAAPGAFRAGDVVGLSDSVDTYDPLPVAVVNVDDTLFDSAPTPDAGFNSSVGAGVFTVKDPFGPGFGPGFYGPLADGEEVELLRLSFKALMTGSTRIGLNSTTGVIDSEIDPDDLAQSLIGGSLTVRSNAAVPEPGTLCIWSLGSALLLGGLRRRKN